MGKKNTIAVNGDTFSYDEAVELTGHGRYNYLLLFTCSLITNACALDMFGFATVVAASSCDLKLNLTQLGILASAPFAGVLFAFAWGYFADMKGRRRALLLSNSVGFVFALASSFSTHWLVMLIFKIIGCGFSSAGFTLTMALLGECTGNKHRSQHLFIMNSFNLVSELFSFSLAWLILPLDFRVPIPWMNMVFRPWRLFSIVQALPLGIGAALMFCLHESPKYLASNGDYVKALEVLKSIYERNGGNREDYPVKHLVQPPFQTEKSTEGQSFWMSLQQQTLPIFKPPLLWRTIQLFFLLTLCCTTNNVFVMWYPTIVNFFFNSFNSPDMSDQTFCERVFGNIVSPDTGAYQCNDVISTSTLYAGMLYGLFYFIVSLGVVKVASRPKLVLISILLISGASNLLVNQRQPVVNMIFFTLLQCTSLGIGCVASYFVDLYPTMHRGLVTSLAMMVARLFSLVGVSVVGAVITHHCEVTFYSWAVYVFIGAGVCLFLPADRKSIK
ncbi:synaptic vesicle glycoprotein 2B-like [Anticarsia gemmatalis]|uniref:synaptic vesicle glycoprotein 2B-like n=1 Tax=Anticarsia gemmatalis TaxID=129554 RepID=UPI003F775292